jgi:hypothetical protein
MSVPLRANLRLTKSAPGGFVPEGEGSVKFMPASSRQAYEATGWQPVVIHSHLVVFEYAEVQ